MTIARKASERSLIISLTDSFICLPPFYDYIIARLNVLVKNRLKSITKYFLASFVENGAFFVGKIAEGRKVLLNRTYVYGSSSAPFFSFRKNFLRHFLPLLEGFRQEEYI